MNPKFKDIKLLIHNTGFLPFRIINPYSVDNGLTLGGVYLGRFDNQCSKIQLVNNEFEVYMTLSPETAIPVNCKDIRTLSILSKKYAFYIYDKHYKSLFPDSAKQYASWLGVKLTTLKSWAKY